MYLLEESPESQEMRSKITNLLESREESAILLALQLLKGGGVHKSHLSYMLALFTWQDLHWENAKQIKMSAKMLFNKSATQDMKTFQFNNPLFTRKELSAKRLDVEPAFSKYIGEYAEKANLDAASLAIMALITLRNVGARYLLQHESRSAFWVLDKMYEETHAMLDFRNLKLPCLPDAIGDFPKTRLLNIKGNKFDDLPDSLKNLTQINHIEFDYHSLGEKALDKLMSFFPRLMSETLYGLACEVKRKAGKSIYPKPNQHPAYVEAIAIFEKAVKCDTDYAEIWHNIGACWVFYGQPEKGRQALEKASALYKFRFDNAMQATHNSTFSYNLFWLSCVYALLQEKEKAYSCLGNISDKYYLQKAQGEEDWAMYREDAEFKLLCSGRA